MADRISKRNLMVIFDFSSSLITIVFAVTLFTGVVSVIWIGVVVTLLSVISILYQPTVQASIPVLVDEKNLLKANGIVSSVSALSNFAGPILGGILYAAAGIDKIVIISGVSFFLSAVMEIFIHIPYEKKPSEGGAVSVIVSDMKEGFRYILHENRFVVKIMCIACAMNLFLTPLLVVGLPYMIKIMMGMPDQYFGFTQGAVSLAMIVGAVSVGFLNNRLRVRNVYVLLVFTAALLVPMALSVSTLLPDGMVSYVVLSAASFCIMFFVTILNIFVMTAIQKKTPTALIGKVMAILIAVASCAMPLGQILFGVLFDRFTGSASLVIVGVVLLTLLMAFITKTAMQTELEEESEIN